ncbi:hypothetical protein Q4512_08420 [Oceanihabitans sp. 2_MG-2023]|uniref:hypothetical protein n=1 Tax=Oceanihabitans sp. 2_MG-2023 TaxID=3062661 RepID=UPI0026E17A8E|nr:hypothetical protein [Oceanihabitans sp. 2_MG-2023]MDO6596938.1 hypothetical protein [Oceanihabitans sp. 2_MG-2023]
MENKTPQKSIFSLISGLIFFGLGSFITYKYFFTEEVITTLRLVLSFVMIGFGVYRLYNYFTTK